MSHPLELVGQLPLTGPAEVVAGIRIRLDGQVDQPHDPLAPQVAVDRATRGDVPEVVDVVHEAVEVHDGPIREVGEPA